MKFELAWGRITPETIFGLRTDVQHEFRRARPQRELRRTLRTSCFPELSHWPRVGRDEALLVCLLLHMRNDLASVPECMARIAHEAHARHDHERHSAN